MLDYNKRHINVTEVKSDKSMVCTELNMVLIEDPRMIFADMRLRATSTPTVIPTRYHRNKYRAQNNNNCTND